MFSLKTMKRYSIEKMCKVLQVGQRSYYHQSVSDRKQRVCLLKKITSIYFESKQRYGSPRMKVELF
jgi:hypothetical protein